VLHTITREFLCGRQNLKERMAARACMDAFQISLSLPRSLTKGSESASMQMSWRESWRGMFQDEHTPFSVQLDPSTNDKTMIVEEGQPWLQPSESIKPEPDQSC
jgi:hypothetical protein